MIRFDAGLIAVIAFLIYTIRKEKIPKITLVVFGIFVFLYTFFNPQFIYERFCFDQNVIKIQGLTCKKLFIYHFAEVYPGKFAYFAISFLYKSMKFEHLHGSMRYLKFLIIIILTFGPLEYFISAFLQTYFSDYEFVLYLNDCRLGLTAFVFALKVNINCSINGQLKIKQGLKEVFINDYKYVFWTEAILLIGLSTPQYIMPIIIGTFYGMLFLFGFLKVLEGILHYPIVFTQRVSSGLFYSASICFDAILQLIECCQRKNHANARVPIQKKFQMQANVHNNSQQSRQENEKSNSFDADSEQTDQNQITQRKGDID